MTAKWAGRRIHPKQAALNEALGNEQRVDGLDRCYCGCKYWEHDRCVDCGGTEPQPEDEL